MYVHVQYIYCYTVNNNRNLVGSLAADRKINGEKLKNRKGYIFSSQRILAADARRLRITVRTNVSGVNGRGGGGRTEPLK
jgi:hypothetical protein